MRRCPVPSSHVVKSIILCPQEGRLTSTQLIFKGATVAVFWEGGEELFSFDCDVGIFKDLEKGVTEPLSEFMEWDEGFETYN